MLLENGVVRATGVPEDVVDLYRETAVV